MISFNLFSLTPRMGTTGTQGKTTLNINVKHDVSTTTSPTSAAASQGKTTSSRVEKMYEELVDTNGLSNKSLLEGLGQEEDNKVFQGYIERFTLNDSGELKSMSEYNVKGMVNTIAAKYAALSKQIEDGNYSDAEKAEMQKRLDTQLEDGLKTLSERFVGSGVDLFNALDMGKGDQVTVKESLVELVKQYKDEFNAFLDSDEGKAFLEQAQKDNPDVDLLTDDVALTNALLYNKAERLVAEEKAKEEEAKVQASKDAVKTANGQDVTKTADDEESEETSKVGKQLFTLEDLSSFGELQTNLSTFLNSNVNKSEEEIGYQLGLTYVKAQEIMKEYGASEFLTKTFNSGFDTFVENTIKTFNDTLDEKQETAEETSSNADPNSYKRLDESVINSTFNSVVSYYNATGSAMDAMVSGFEFAQNSFLNNQANNPSTVRYNVGSQFFDNFYTTPKGSGKGNSSDMYSIGISYYKRYTTAMQ